MQLYDIVFRAGRAFDDFLEGTERTAPSGTPSPGAHPFMRVRPGGSRRARGGDGFWFWRTTGAETR
jgi:hypothetical protein